MTGMHKKEKHGACEASCARALVSPVLGGGLCSSLLQTPSFYVFIHAYSSLASSTKQLRISLCGVVLHHYKGQNGILCFVRTPTRCVWRCPGTGLGIGEDQRQRGTKLCHHLCGSVESFSAVSEGPLCSAFSPTSSGSSLDSYN